MNRDERFYAFIVTPTSHSCIRRISIHKRWLKASACVAMMVLGAAVYGLYELSQQVSHRQVGWENDRLRAENKKQREQLKKLMGRVEAVEDASRRLKEISGVSEQEENAVG
ncbi:MAG: hypothetical protein ACRD68_17225, partial [Pyrinomonadaceae bacterium]